LHKFAQEPRYMKIKLKYSIGVIAALAIGFLVGRGTTQDSDVKSPSERNRGSTFENDALGFLNWFRLNGRDEISHEVLVQNLRILESKAIASDKLIAFRAQKSKTQQTSENQLPTLPESNAK